MNKTFQLKIGALQKLLSINGFKTLNSFSKRKDGSTVLDIKTLRKINNGESVKYSHLEIIGTEIFKSVDQILSFNENEYFDEFSQKIVIHLNLFGTEFNLQGTSVGIEELINTVNICHEIYIKLGINTVSEDLERQLIEFEENIKQFHKNHTQSIYKASDLKTQIEEKKLYGKIRDTLDLMKLKMNKNFIMTSLEFSESSRGNEGCILYHKKRVLVLAIVENNVKNVNFEITKRSDKPPLEYLTKSIDESSGSFCQILFEGDTYYFNKQKTAFKIQDDDYENAVLVDRITGKVLYERSEDQFFF